MTEDVKLKAVQNDAEDATEQYDAVTLKFGNTVEVRLDRQDGDSIAEFVNPKTGETFIVSNTCTIEAILEHLRS
jgi:hypothetical protein